MYIYPKYMEEAAKSNWIVKFIRFLGVIQVIWCVALGALFCGAPLAALLIEADIMVQEAAAASAMLIGGIVGFVVGLFVGLAFFALAQVVDDLHAIRVQTSAFVAFESDNVHLGK